MHRAMGYAVEMRDGVVVKERDSFTCCHCNGIVFVKPKQDPSEMGGMCLLCMKHTCPTCAGNGCVPFEKKLRAMESRDRLLRAALGV